MLHIERDAWSKVEITQFGSNKMLSLGSLAFRRMKVATRKSRRATSYHPLWTPTLNLYGINCRWYKIAVAVGTRAQQDIILNSRNKMGVVGACS